MQPDLIEQLRALGLSMGGRYAPMQATDPETGEPYTFVRYVGWTTDQAKADAARELGATVVPYASRAPRFSGWEVSARDTTEADTG